MKTLPKRTLFQGVLEFAKNNAVSLLLLLLLGAWIGHQRLEVWRSAKQLIGKTAPNFVLAKSHSSELTDFRKSTKGKKTLLVFWATWCGVCRSEIDTLREAQEKFSGKGFALISVVLPHNESQSEIQNFIQEKKINYPVWMGDGSASNAYKVEALPTTVWIDKTGRIEDFSVGRSFGLIGKLEDWLHDETAHN